MTGHPNERPDSRSAPFSTMTASSPFSHLLRVELPLMRLLVLPFLFPNARHTTPCLAFLASSSSSNKLHHNHYIRLPTFLKLSSDEEETEWTSDFDGIFIGGDNLDLPSDKNDLKFNLDKIQSDREEKLDIPDDDDDDKGTDNGLSNLLLDRKRNGQQRDLTAVTSRQFTLGEDLILTDFVGNLGFEEVTDWEYFYENEDDPTDRQVVQPNPFDASKPKRTRTSSGSVVRVFRGEWTGRLGGSLRARGLDRRVLVKEYTGQLALALAEREQSSLSKLQSEMVSDNEEAVGGDWIQAAVSRSVLARKDDAHMGTILEQLANAPFLGSLGDVNLAELDGNMDPNDFYRAMGVPPPKADAVWVVYEYAGLNTIGSYSAVPPEVRRSQLPPRRNFFGSFQDPKPLPPFRARANYIVNGIMKGSIEALATLHEAGIAHRSIGRSSFVLSGPSQDKREPSSIYSTEISGLTVKLADFGFSSSFQDSTLEEEFITRARAFGFSFRKGEMSLDVTNFAMAEDLHALGFVLLGLLLTTLAELPKAEAPMPNTDEDTLQRLLGEIFAKDFQLFREYVEEEEVWSSLVSLLDENDSVGWSVLETLFKAREKTADSKDSQQMVTARGLLSNPFFQPIR